jgi:hypothetical protein
MVYQLQSAGMTEQYNGMLKCYLHMTVLIPRSWHRGAEQLPNVVCSLNEQPRRDDHSPLDRLLASGQCI